jgi:serine/threonine-protein kinase
MVSDWDGKYLAPGTLIDDKFEVRRLLGTGAMGAVVEATHVLRRAPVALKFMSPRMLDLPGVVERFLNEGVAASRINNEHVVKVLDVSKLPNGQPYLVMEFLDGEDLAALLEREGKRGLADVARAVHFVLQVLRGLQVAHQAGIIHRDLKPANCFVVTYDGDPDFIKIVDFGISKLQGPENELYLTQEGSTMGTPLYVSLEQARDAANVDARSDLYSVAVILYELLCGHTPFMPKTIPELFIQLATVTPKSLDEIRDLPPGLAALVAKGLAKNREDRFQSTRDMAAALAPYSDSRSEHVLRQLLQRGSTQLSRGPSTSPARGASDSAPAADERAPPPLDGPGTLLAVSKSDAVAGRSLNLETSKPGLRKALVVAALSLLVATAVVVAFVTRSRSTAGENKAAASPVEVPARVAPPPVAAEASAAAIQAEPAASAALPPAASGTPAARLAPPNARPAVAASAPPSAGSSARPGESRSAPKPSLHNIGIQD